MLSVLCRVDERIGGPEWTPPWVRRQHLARYRWASRYVKERTVLDAACGLGYGSQMLRDQGRAARVVGLDAGPEAIEHAEATYKEDERLSFQTGDVLELPFDANSFDVYVSFETIEHLADVPRYLAEAKRVLKPGGLFLVSIPNRTLANPRLPPQGRPFNRFHLREYTPPELLEELSPYFSDCELFGISPFSDTYVRLLNRVPRLTRHFPARVHQAAKVWCELLRVFPACEVEPLPMSDAMRAEYLVVLARKGMV